MLQKKLEKEKNIKKEIEKADQEYEIAKTERKSEEILKEI